MASPLLCRPLLIEDAVMHVISEKMQFSVTAPGAFTPTLVEPFKLSQPTEESSEQSRSDRLWRELIFSDTWHWDPLTSTQHSRHAANGGRGATASDKETRSEAMIRQGDGAGKTDYSQNELYNVVNEGKSTRGPSVPIEIPIRARFYPVQLRQFEKEIRRTNDIFSLVFTTLTRKQRKKEHFIHTFEKRRRRLIVVKVTGTYEPGS